MGLNFISWVLEIERQQNKECQRNATWEVSTHSYWVWICREGTTNQGIWQHTADANNNNSNNNNKTSVLQTARKQGPYSHKSKQLNVCKTLRWARNRFFFTTPRNKCSLWYLEFTPITLLLDFQPIELKVKICAM